MLWNTGGSGKGKEFRLKLRVHGSKPQAGSLSCRGVPGAPVHPGHVWGCRAERRVPPEASAESSTWWSQEAGLGGCRGPGGGARDGSAPS